MSNVNPSTATCHLLLDNNLHRRVFLNLKSFLDKIIIFFVTQLHRIADLTWDCEGNVVVVEDQQRRVKGLVYLCQNVGLEGSPQYIAF